MSTRFEREMNRLVRDVIEVRRREEQVQDALVWGDEKLAATRRQVLHQAGQRLAQTFVDTVGPRFERLTATGSWGAAKPDLVRRILLGFFATHGVRDTETYFYGGRTRHRRRHRRRHRPAA